jgi:hypothetical protein
MSNEAEVSRDGQIVAIVYEASDGWHTNIIDTHLSQPESDFDKAINTARKTLSQYVNRRGKNPPQKRDGRSLCALADGER